MEEVYNFVKTKLINIREEFMKYQNEVKSDGGEKLPSCDDEIRQLVNFDGTDEDFAEILDSIDLEKHLKSVDDVRVLPFEPSQVYQRREPVAEIPKKALRLQTFSTVLDFKKRKSRGSFFPNNYLNHRIPNDIELTGIDDMQPFEDVVIHVKFYRPFRNMCGKISRHPKFSEEFCVLGTQKLTELRDKISCLCNDGPLFDVSEAPFKEQPRHELDPGFFFITDTFYNDKRDPRNPDYSEVIRKWAAEREVFSRDFKAAHMEEATFFDLSINLGHPQVYMHCGNCEHVFIFSSIELLTPQHNLSRKNYPILHAVAVPWSVVCNICGQREFTYLIKDSEKHLHDPTYLCSSCMETYHYAGGKKIGSFQAYKLNRNEILDVIPVGDEDEDKDSDSD